MYVRCMPNFVAISSLCGNDSRQIANSGQEKFQRVCSSSRKKMEKMYGIQIPLLRGKLDSLFIELAYFQCMPAKTSIVSQLFNSIGLIAGSIRIFLVAMMLSMSEYRKSTLSLCLSRLSTPPSLRRQSELGQFPTSQPARWAPVLSP